MRVYMAGAACFGCPEWAARLGLGGRGCLWAFCPARAGATRFGRADLPERLQLRMLATGLGEAGHLAMASILSIKELRKAYGERVAVDGVSFEVGRDEIVGLLGPNGAGKTTTINMVLGVLQPDSGTIHIDGVNLATHRSAALGRTNFAAVYAPLPGNLTVQQSLRVFGLLYSVSGLSERINMLIREFDLERLRDVKCGVLSSGEQTRAALAKAMLNQPQLLLLDEPTASLDPSAAREIRARIRALARTGKVGVLWTSHNMYEVDEVCDRVLFLSHGKKLLEGDPKALPGEHGKENLEELFVAVAREPLTLEKG
jgi:ABC-2 type transport system ATP-binding protein